MIKDSEKLRSGETEILRILNMHNPWWDKCLLQKLFLLMGGIFYKLLEALENPKISAIIGARSVGKRF
ncbi:MAG: hypothetical protein RMJ15_02500 [Nitrososphaerota archaeon]|nr:hypothetical protein [Candidatus Bathyarchaeota archaeon]MDW8022602.1 hypothetical protein [Nitrososphaerota archaeon]